MDYFFLNANVKLSSYKEIKDEVLVEEFKKEADKLAEPFNKDKPKEDRAIFEPEVFAINLVFEPNSAATIFIKSNALIITLFSTFLAFNM